MAPFQPVDISILVNVNAFYVLNAVFLFSKGSPHIQPWLRFLMSDALPDATLSFYPSLGPECG